MNRREFLKSAGKTALAIGGSTGIQGILNGCVTLDPKKDWSQVSPDEFKLDEYESWHIKYKLYNKYNKNFKGPGHQITYFKKAIELGYTPSPGWKINPHTSIVSVAPGEVGTHFKIKMAGHAGGYLLHVRHSDIGDPYYAKYTHLDSIVVDRGQMVKRGDLLGYAGSDENDNVVSLIGVEIQDRNIFPHNNLIDPDKMGQNHHHMNYWDESIEIETTNCNERFKTQERLLQDFKDHFSFPGRRYIIHNKVHARGYYGVVVWSIVEQFRYVESLYEVKPELFPSLSPTRVKSISNEFYANQPTIWTLPFKKPKPLF